MAINQAAGAAVIYKYARDPMENIANNTYEAQKMSAASVVHTEEERQAVMDAEDVRFMFSLNGTSMMLEEAREEESHILKLVDEGKPIPVTKGPNGVRTEIDGSTGESKSYSSGYPIPEYAWSATHFKQDAMEILKTISPNVVQGAAAEARSEIANDVVRPSIVEQIRQGGVS